MMSRTLRRLRDALSRKRGAVAFQERSNRLHLSALCSAYENVFAQVRPLVDEMETVIPYGADERGKPLPPELTPELVALRAPNGDMGYLDFIDSALVAWLTLSELNIHVWKDRDGAIESFTVLPAGCRTGTSDEAGRTLFQMLDNRGKIVTLTEDDVLTLRFSRNPLDLAVGVSPTSSVFTFSQIDDLMAQYQKSFIENGAVPAYLTFIRAATYAEFLEKRADMERNTKGARGVNKAAYIWRAYDSDSGNELDEVEVKTIQGDNSTLDITGVMTMVQSRLNTAFGVGKFILGDDSSAKYDNAEISDLQFTKRRVYPALKRFWGQFQHELDRVTGGIGYQIVFDLDVPELTDRLKTKAETGQINSEALSLLIQAGASPKAAILALGLSDDWLDAAAGISSAARSTEAQEEKPPIGFTTLKPRDRIVDVAIVRDREALSSADAYTPVFGDDEEDEKRIYQELLKIAEAYAKELDAPIEAVKQAILAVLTRQADQGANAGAKVLQGLAYGETADEKAVEELQAEVGTVLSAGGFHVSDEIVENLRARVDTLVESYREESHSVLEQTLNSSREQGLSQQQITRVLSEAIPRRRAETIARNETVNAFRVGRIGNDEYLAGKYGLRIRKVWRCRHDGKTCPLCEAMDGETVGLREAFPSEKVVVNEDGEEETLYFTPSVWNMNGESPNGHVNCRCYFNEEVDDG